MSTLLCTFNVNNLFARYRFGKTFPGDISAKSKSEDVSRGYLPVYNLSNWELFNEEQRRLAVLAITRGGSALPPDILCLVEVESLLALRKFNEDHDLLDGAYKYALLIDSRDFRQIDVGILSNREILNVRSHVDDWDGDREEFVFSRDCLEVEVALNDSGTQKLTLFLNHLKSKFAQSDSQKVAAADRRKRQAEYVRELVKQRFEGAAFNSEMFAVIGDLNDEPESDPVKPLTQQAGLFDALRRISAEEERWTEWYRGGNSVSQLDYILMSPALHKATNGVVPEIERRGIGYKSKLKSGGFGPRKSHFHRTDPENDPVDISFNFERFAGVDTKNAASDHCPVFLQIP